MISKSKKRKHPHCDICDVQTVLESYKLMLLIRRFEERCAQAYGNGLISGFCHLYIGQEAVVVGVKAAMRPSDSMITAYRDHGHALASGISPHQLMAELFGKADGSSGGKGGSMHIFNADHNFFGGHGIVGAQVPLGTGIAFAEKYRDSGNICIVFFGDGACNQGQVYESFNIAKLWDLPVLYIIENNRYAMGTSVHRGAANHDKLYERGAGFAIPGAPIDGMDFWAVMHAVVDAIAVVRTGQPVLLEMQTYRYRGHSMSDPAKYRTKEEVNAYKQERDALHNMSDYIVKHELLSQTDLDALDIEIVDTVSDAYQFAQNAKEPSEADLFTHIY